MTVVSVHHLAEITIHSYRWGSIPLVGRSLGGPVTGFSTTKTLSSAAGSWSVSVVGSVQVRPSLGPPATLIELAEEGDWITIDVVKDGRAVPLMIGKIDGIQGSVSVDGTGAVSASWSLHGRDFGCVAEDTPLYINPFDPSHSNATANMQAAMRSNAGQRGPGPLCRDLLGAILGGTATAYYGALVELPPTLVPGATHWWDLVDTVAYVQTDLRGLVYDPNAVFGTDSSPSVWSFVEQWSNGMLNEMWLANPVDATTRKCSLVIRERPFVNSTQGTASPWTYLKVNIVDLSTVSAVALGRGQGRVNWLSVENGDRSWMGESQTAIYRPLIDRDSITRYGLRRRPESTPYLTKSTADSAEVKAWASILVDWNSLAHRELRGTITIEEMRPDVLVGERLTVVGGPLPSWAGWPADNGDPNLGMGFYVEAIRHDYQDGATPSSRTQVQLSHGWPEEARVRDVLLASLRFEPVPVVSANAAGGGSAPKVVP